MYCLQWNDVAILTLEDDVQYSSTIQPICLATGDNSYVNSKVTVAGWGTLTEGGQQPATLMKVTSSSFLIDQCQQASHFLC
jgi:hypothetical protein